MLDYETHMSNAQRALDTALESLSDEIAAYPTPVSGCDAQFTRLLSDRTRLAEARRTLQETPFIPTPRVMEPGARVESR